MSKIFKFKIISFKKTSHYFYDALGRRFKKEIVDHQNSANSYTRKYQYDGQEILAELDGYNSTLAVYTHSTLRTDDVLSVDIRSTKLATQEGSYFYLKDALGSIIDVADSSGNLVQHYTYSAFGKILSIQDNNGVDIIASPVIKTSYTYTNREYDEESGMYYYRARYYEPSIGRFIQEDPHPGNIQYPSTHSNKYSYVSNNPTLNIDPNGEFGIIAGIIIAGAISGTLNVLSNGGGLEEFFQGFIMGAAGAAFVAFGSWAAIGIAGAQVGTGAAIMYGALGGALAGGAWGAITVGTTEAIIMGVVAGGIGGGFYGKYGFGLESSGNTQDDIASGINDFNRGVTSNIIQPPKAPVPAPAPSPVPPYECAPIGQYEPNPICF